MYGLVVSNKKDEAKAERIIQKFTRRAHVRHEHSVVFVYSGRPVRREVCMKCDGNGACPLGIAACPVDRVIDDTLLGLKALLYVRVKVKLVYPL